MMKNAKKIASCLVLTMGLTIAAPVMAAAEPTAPTATTGSTVTNQYTMAQIQALAVQKNRTNNVMKLNLQLLEENRMTADNSRADLSSALSGLNSSNSSTNAVSAQLQSQMNAIREQMAATTDAGAIAGLTAQLMVLESQLQQLSSAAGSTGSTAATIMANEKKLDTQIDALNNQKEDIEKNQQDWENEIKLISGLLVINAVELQTNIDLLEKSNALAAQMEQLETLKTSLGLSIDLNISGKTVETAQAASQLKQAQAGLKTLKRQINDLIGRPLDAELNLIGCALPETIQTAPLYNEPLVEKLTKSNYKLKTLERDIIDYHKQGDDLTDNGVTDSSQFKIIDRNIDLKKLDIENQKNSIANDLKNQLDRINSTGRAYKEAMLAYDKEAKNADYLKMRLDLGLIAPIEYQSSELTLLNAENQKIKTGYDYYLAWEEYKAMEQGISLSTYSQYKSF